MSVNGSTRPLSGSRRSTVSSPRRGSRATLLNGSKAVLALALVLAAATACSKSSDDGSHEAKDWKVGDCAGPDSSKKDAYQPLDCDDSKATLKALEIKDGAIFSDSIQCPAGTDAIISVKVSFGSGDASTGIPSKTICGRNLSGDHPGDAGAGGGQLVKGDCVDDQAKEVACGSGGSGVTKVLDLTKTAKECPVGSKPLELFPSPGRPYDAICTGKA
ncbi:MULTISPECIES: hypothetical protein [unclassified Streptomyces]|uniref:hypothetical protein n=1 Tax=unclassified Streptomyces TaxID=2593676 RepID=UPI000F5C2852|nr:MULTISPECIES: hypothetical protein [unclassified Streptomyces]WSG52518.1 hypothetical protein OHA38_23585 [Streptomyces sp. NBC_01732]WSX03156.1 hypothetical protein OG355_23590 [Streptomyces sp. NBC_00987]MCX4394884.1 hypothetical protein [Streptomyces sp. NBC_01767]MCX5102458.1 hypothetical protein [Streptomyces sp. NBC_00439]MCX5502272.1 hypothetical protein [Streptomyces sp. NBC_00052]